MQLRFGDALNGLAVERFGLAAEQLVLHVKSVAVTLPIQRMSREDKLRAMEALWEDLSRDDVEINSPAWHAEALRETEVRPSFPTGKPRSAGFGKRPSA